jgi:hypothetical protein
MVTDGFGGFLVEIGVGGRGFGQEFMMSSYFVLLLRLQIILGG